MPRPTTTANADTNERDKGFTLIEVLVVTVLLAVIAGIVITNFIAQKKKGVDGAVRADLYHIGQAENSYVLNTSGSFLDGTVDVSTLIQNGAAFTGSNVFSIGFVDKGFCLRGSNPKGNATGTGSGGFIWYDSQRGGLIPGRSTTASPGGACEGVTSWQVLTDGTNDTPMTNPPVTPPVVTPPVVTPPPPPPSTPPVAVTPPPANDECIGSTEMPQLNADMVKSTANTTNIGATNTASVWFHTWAPRSAYTTWAVESPATPALVGTRTLEVFQGPNSNTNIYQNGGTACPAVGSLTLIGTVTGVKPGFTHRTGSGNENYWVRVSSSDANQAAFVLDHWTNASTIQRDNFGNAEGISVNQNETRTFAYYLETSLFGTLEAGEGLPVGTSTVWYRVDNYYSTATPTYTLTILPPTSGKALGNHTVEVYSGSTSAGSRGTLVTTATGNGTSTVTFNGPANGSRFWVRIVSLSGSESGSYQVRLARGAN